MSKRQPMMNILDKAKGKEKKYNWLEAAELYKQALGIAGKKDFLKKGEIQERIGYCLYRSAFQADTQEEFKQRMRRATKAYEKTHEFYAKLANEQKAARTFRCEAIAKYLGYWLTSVPSEKRALLDECLELEGKALACFSESGDTLEYGRTCNELPSVSLLRAALEWDKNTKKSIIERGLRWGEKSFAGLSGLGDSHELARAYYTLSEYLCESEVFIAELEDQEKNRLKLVKYLSKAVDLSEKVGDDYLLGLSHRHAAMHVSMEAEEDLKHFEKALECGRRTRDNLLIATALYGLAYSTVLKGLATEDPEKWREQREKALQFYNKAQHHSSIISFIYPSSGFMGPPSGYTEHYWALAERETDAEKRLEFLEKAEKTGMKALKLAEDSEIPLNISRALTLVALTLATRSLMESDLTEKRSLLEKALKHREKAMEIYEQQQPFFYWNRGVMHTNLARRKAELADIEPDFESKQRLLDEAMLSLEKGLKLCNKQMPYLERRGYHMLFWAIRRDQDTYASLLTRLYDLTNNPKHLRKSIEISQKAIESASKADMVTLMAESYWKIAKAQDILGEQLKAAENFEHASKAYMKAAGKIPQLKDFYQDHASYMQAWSEIEKAKHNHAEKQYGRAKEHYEKAASLHTSTEHWNYLSPNYAAWARLEDAEDLSRREQTEEAKGLFQQAAKLFAEAEKSIRTKLEKTESKDEKELLDNLTKASDIRGEYCHGRVVLEEAKVLDRQGDHMASSAKYGSAVERFKKTSDAMEDESDRQELRPIMDLCKAWQKMTQAEAEASPDLYLEASKLFEEAKEHSSDEKAKVLALGHSSLCKALEAGTRFEATRDMTMYSTAKKHMEAAENYYVKAGFKNASEYAKATYILFDAYIYMNQAQSETDPEKKTQYYQMAERTLQASAGSYLKAKHPEKSEQVQRLLEGIREKRQLAVSLTEVLHAPTITSTTTSFSTPTASREQAIGLERFEHADIQANLILRVREVRVGEDIDLEIELINAGKAPALLIKIEKVIPEGFEVKEVPEAYRVEDRFLNLKGKRLNPLKTEEVKIVVKPLSKGTFTMKPRIRYLDENGKYKSHEPEPVTITVKELGIKGWIKG